MKHGEIKNEYLYDTRIENMFINEFMVSAPGNFVKVYLVALMYVDMHKDVTIAEIAKTLNIEINEVERAFEYWRECGLVRGSGENIEFISMKEKMYGRKITKNTEEMGRDSHILDNEELKSMYENVEKTLNRPITPKEMNEMAMWIEDYNAKSEVIAFAFSYCTKRGKPALNYIRKVVIGWTSRGFTTVLDVENYLREYDQRFYDYKRIMKALGFFRGASEEEKRFIDTWFDDFGYDLKTILEGCKKSAGISNPNIKYVNTVLENWRNGPGGKASSKPGEVTKRNIMDYYEKIRNKAESDAKVRRAEVIKKVPKIDALEDEMKNIHVDLSRVMVTGGVNKKIEIDKLRDQVSSIQKEINRLLITNNFGDDYLEVRYKCPICKDTGTLDSGEQCKCFIERKSELEGKEQVE